MTKMNRALVVSALAAGIAVTGLQAPAHAATYISGTLYVNQLPAPLVFAITDGLEVPIAIGNLNTTKDRLVSEGFASPTIESRDVYVGESRNGNCENTTKSNEGKWSFTTSAGAEFLASKDWAKPGLIRIKIADRTTYPSGTTLCVINRVKWTSGSTRSVTFASTPTNTPNLTPIYVVGLPNPLPSPSLSLSPTPSASPSVSSSTDRDDVQATPKPTSPVLSLTTIAQQVASLGSSLKTSPTNLQANPALLAAAIAGAQEAQAAAAQAAAQNAADEAARAEAARLEAEAAAFLAQAGELAAQAALLVGETETTQAALGAAAGFDPKLAPVVGTNGKATAAGITLSMKSAASVKRGKKLKVNIAIKPKTLVGVLTVALVKNTKGVLTTVSTQTAPAIDGKATATFTVPKKAKKGTYSVTASFLKASENPNGLTAIKSVKVR